jgi:alkylation response protein AidB-like acyl-CoA dehydrogenase
MKAETPTMRDKSGQDMPGAPDYVARARALQPLIAAAAPDIEAAGELTPAVVAGLHQAQLFRLFIPRWLDGGEVPLSTYAQVIEAIARADASTAWCLSQIMSARSRPFI